jgi:hypothetical protein
MKKMLYSMFLLSILCFCQSNAVYFFDQMTDEQKNDFHKKEVLDSTRDEAIELLEKKDAYRPTLLPFDKMSDSEKKAFHEKDVVDSTNKEFMKALEKNKNFMENEADKWVLEAFGGTKWVGFAKIPWGPSDNAGMREYAKKQIDFYRGQQGLLGKDIQALKEGKEINDISESSQSTYNYMLKMREDEFNKSAQLAHDINSLKENKGSAGLSESSRTLYDNLFNQRETEFNKTYYGTTPSSATAKSVAADTIEPQTFYSPNEIIAQEPSLLQRFINSVKEWFRVKPGIPRTYTFPTFNRTMIKQRLSNVSVPQAIVPSPKTLERAQKLTEPYNPAPASASKALKQQERFGIGYQ